MTKKKLAAKRLLLFLVLAFGISWIPALILNRVFGYHAWFETNRMPLFALPVLYAPALANVLTRKLTHEGWEHSLLRLRLKGNLKYYLTSLLLVSALSLPSGALAVLISGGDWGTNGLTGTELASALLSTFATAPLLGFLTFGEEFGWRGYMNQKLECLLGTTGTVLAGGILWGLWHAVLTVQGHNFGTEYPGFPYVGIGAMCLLCIANGSILMWLTKKTNSIYPAAILHAMFNNGGALPGQLLSGKVQALTIPQQLLCQIPLYVAGLVCLLRMVHAKRQNATK